MQFRKIENLEKYIMTRFFQFHLLVEKIEYLFYSHEKELNNIVKKRRKEFALFKNLSVDHKLSNELKKIKNTEEFISFEERNKDKYRDFFSAFDSYFWLSWTKQDYKFLKKVYPNLAAISLLTIQYSIIEDSLRRICDYYKYRDKISLSFSDLGSNNSLDIYKKYLTKLVGVNFNFCHSVEWSKIKEIQKIRNKIVHNGGYVEDLDNKKILEKILNKYENIHLNKENVIIIEELFLYEFIDISESFFKSLFNYLKKYT